MYNNLASMAKLNQINVRDNDELLILLFCTEFKATTSCSTIFLF